MTATEHSPVEGGDPDRYRVTFERGGCDLLAEQRGDGRPRPERRDDVVLGLESLPVRFGPGPRRGA